LTIRDLGLKIGRQRIAASDRIVSDRSDNLQSQIFNLQSGVAMYRAYGLLQPGSEFTMAAAEARLRSQFPAYSVSRAGDRITVAKSGWAIELWLNADPSVRTESIGLAEKIAGLADGTDIESCDRRVEVWSDIPDPFVEHLGDFQTVVEVLRSFRGVIPVDPKEPALM
jgi:hypothetical protein